MKYSINVIGAVNNRIARRVPAARDGMLDRLTVFVDEWIRNNISQLDAKTDVSVDTWLEGTSYSKKRRMKLKEVNVDMEWRGLRKKDVELNCFIKDEAYPKYKHPRGIFSRSDKFKTLVGPWFKVIEEAVYKTKWFIKKIPTSERADYLKIRFPYVASKDPGVYRRLIQTDYSAFEASFTRRMMQAIEMRLYEFMVEKIPGSGRFLDLVRNYIQGQNKCHFKRASVRIPAKRMSGEMNTSLGNGFTNLMVFLFIMQERGYECDCVVEGDDLLGTYEGELIPNDDYEDFGFIVKMEYHELPGDASFCGQLFDSELRIITDPLKVVLNFGWTSMQYAMSSEKTKRELIRAKALSLLVGYVGCPILQTLALKYIDLTKYDKFRIEDRDMWKFSNLGRRLKDVRREDAKEVLMETRLFMEVRYGITIEEQFRIEEEIGMIDAIGPLELPSITRHLENVWKEAYDQYVKKIDAKVLTDGSIRIY